MTNDTEREDLDALLADDGWQRFRAYADSLWGDAAVVNRLEQAVGQQLGDEAQAREVTQAILAAKRHIRHLLDWPATRVRELRTKEDSPKKVVASGRAAFTRTRSPRRAL